MINYRKAKPGDIECEVCVYGRPGSGKGSWHRCRYYVHAWTPSAETAVSKRATCDHARLKYPEYHLVSLTDGELPARLPE